MYFIISTELKLDFAEVKCNSTLLGVFSYILLTACLNVEGINKDTSLALYKQVFTRSFSCFEY